MMSEEHILNSGFSYTTVLIWARVDTGFHGFFFCFLTEKSAFSVFIRVRSGFAFY